MSGPHALVTGAAGAIGAAIARALAEARLARSFTLVDLDAERAAAVGRTLGTGTSSRALAWDLDRPSELPAHLREVEDAHGPVDVLVNCAGIMEMRSLAATDWALASRLLRIDLESPLLLMSLIVPGMVQRGSGSVVNVSSMAGVTPLRGCAYYGAAKAGLAMASEIAHLELAPEGVHVVTVYPGPVHSELERRARAQQSPSLVARLVPIGEPTPLGALIARACVEKRPRVVYPAFYALARGAPRVASALTSRVSPKARDA